MAQRQIRSDDTSIWTERFGNGSDGANTITNGTDAQLNTTFTGTAASTSGANTGTAAGWTNGTLILIHQTYSTGAGNWELNKIVSGGGTGSWTLEYALCNNYIVGAQAYKLAQYSSVSVTAGNTFNVSAWNGGTGGILAFLCSGTMTIAGTLNNAGGGFRGGNGSWSNLGGNGNTSTNGTGYAGESWSGAGSHTPDGTGGLRCPANNGGGAGGGVTNSGSEGGAGGGHGGAGSATGGNTPGTTYDNAGLTTATFGSGGGGGNDWEHVDIGGAGGIGGGLTLIIAKNIVVTGGIQNHGQDGQSHAGSNGYNGGGGAGGSILLKSQSLTLGSGLVEATGGTSPLSLGGNGGVGRIHADYLITPTGTTSPTIDTRFDPVLAELAPMFFVF